LGRLRLRATGASMLPGSLKRSIAGIRSLRERGMKTVIANVLMRSNLNDYAGVKRLAQELGAEYTIDPTITPKMDGDRSILPLGIGGDDLRQVFRNGDLVGNVEEFCAPATPVTCGSAPRARTWVPARAVPAWPTWKATCEAHLPLNDHARVVVSLPILLPGRRSRL